MSALCRYCCKSLKSRSDNFPPRKQNRTRSPINMASCLLPKSAVSLSLWDEVPHIFIPKSHLEPREFLISSAKRLLQHNLPIGDITRACSRTTDLARVHWRAHSHWHTALQAAEGRIGSRSTSKSRSCRKWCDRRSRVWRTETRSPSEREPRDPNDLVWATPRDPKIRHCRHRSR